MTTEIEKPTKKSKICKEQIAPLIDQVIDICLKHNIPFIFDAGLGKQRRTDPVQSRYTVWNLADKCDPPANMLEASECLSAWYHMYEVTDLLANQKKKKSEKSAPKAVTAATVTVTTDADAKAAARAAARAAAKAAAKAATKAAPETAPEVTDTGVLSE